MNCLIVDDLIENCKQMHDILLPYGMCDTVDNGQAALDLFEAALEEGVPYDLVLLDIVMPDMDGQETLKRMRDIEQAHMEPGSETVIIMVTAVDAGTEVAEAFEQGRCTGYLHKPISRGRLLVMLSEHGLIPTDWWKHEK